MGPARDLTAALTGVRPDDINWTRLRAGSRRGQELRDNARNGAVAPEAQPAPARSRRGRARRDRRIGADLGRLLEVRVSQLGRRKFFADALMMDLRQHRRSAAADLAAAQQEKVAHV